MQLYTQSSFPSPRRLSIVALAVATLGLAGCETLGGFARNSGNGMTDPLASYRPATHLHEAVPKDKLNTATRQLVAEGLKALDQREYEKASQLFNLALKTDINNSYVHFLVALSYHLRGLGGEGALYALAQQGYELAVQFDPSNAVARHYLGLLYIDRREFASARAQLMEAALYARNEPDLLYDLAVAAYYAKDPRTAYAALEGLRQLENGHASERTLRALAIVAAATGDDAAARGFLKHLEQAGARDLRVAADRVDSWRDAYGSGLMKTQFPTSGGFPSGSSGVPSGSTGVPPGSSGFPPGSGGYPAAGGFSGGQGMPGAQFGGTGQRQPGSAGGFFDKNMVMLDVTIIATEEDNNDTFGINLLEGLRIQFGNSVGTPAVSRQTNINSDLVNSLNNTATRQVTRLIQIPAITYTLNIANAQDRRNEVLARPTLVAMGGQMSTFFSGTDVIGAAVSTGQGGSVQVQKEAGVKLSLLPEFLPEDLIKMQVIAERTFLTNPNSNVLFDFRLDTSKTLVSANVVMKYGETLILSGLSERNTETSHSGVPLLRDIPLVQYLFSRKTDRDFHKSVLILVTPRRPGYTNRAQTDIDAERGKMTEAQRLQAEFEDKYKLWFKPVPNIAQALTVLNTSPIFREFRSGDMTIESWVSRSSHGGRLLSALNFIYY